MADETRIKLIGAGLILATVVVALLIFTQRFNAQKQTKELNVPPVVQASPTPSVEPSPMAAATSTPSPDILAQTTKGGQPLTKGSLPATGFPTGLFVIFSISAALAGYGLKKFPK